MARFLCTVWPFAGHLHPCLAVAHALRRRGHTVGFYSGESVREVIEGEGFTFFPFDRLAARLEELVDGVAAGAAGHDDSAFYERMVTRYAAAYGHRGLPRAWALKAVYREWTVGTVVEQVSDLEDVVSVWRPDVVVTDPTMWAPYLVLYETLHVPVAVLSFFAGCLIPGPQMPYPGLGLQARGRWYVRLQARLVARMALLFMADLRRDANALRRRYGLPSLSGPVLAAAGRMPLYLVTTTPDYDYDRHDLPSSVQYVGACLWDGSQAEAPAPWLSTLRDDRPVVYVTEGSAQTRGSPILGAAVEGLADLPIQVVMTTGRHRDVAQLGLTPLPSNVHAVRFVPHSQLFPHLSVVVTNGGSSTIRAALAAGLPLVVVPMAWDQFDNAQRVQDAGAGLCLKAEQCTAERLRSAVNLLLRDHSFAANARRLGDSSRRFGGPDRAAALLEGLSVAGSNAPAQQPADRSAVVSRRVESKPGAAGRSHLRRVIARLSLATRRGNAEGIVRSRSDAH